MQLGGALNGYLIAWLRLPSLTVTLATLALFRGIAQILLGDHSIQDMPQWFFGVDRYIIAGTPIPASLCAIFLLLAVIFGAGAAQDRAWPLHLRHRHQRAGGVFCRCARQSASSC